MKDHLPGEPHILPLHLKDIFPLCDLSLPVASEDWLVNAAYEKLFEELIPGFKDGEVHFVLAEVLELDKEESQPRVLVYSNRDESGVDELLKEYFRVINSLSADQWSISKTDALYTSSRIWCAEMGSADCPITDDKRTWSHKRKDSFPAGYGWGKVAEEEEITKISVAFERYVNELHALHLNNYRFAYVMLIPIFLGSMYGKMKARTKLGAIFLHFATAKRIEDERALLRIYGRTLLFWHYYFTSEAIYRRQDMLERTRKSMETTISLFQKIKPSIDDIRYMLHAVQKPLAALEADLDPVRAILFGEKLSKFFRDDQPVPIMDGKLEIIPRHDWVDGAVGVFKTLIAGLLVKAFGLEKDVEPTASNLWEQVSNHIDRRARVLDQPLYQALLKSLPHLSLRDPSEEQVEETFRTVKSWFSDAYKDGKNIPGMPFTMLEFSLGVWGCDLRKRDLESPTFWVASEPPVLTINALWLLHQKHHLRAAEIRVSREEGGLDPITSCEMELELEQSHGEVSSRRASLERLRDALDTSLERRVEPIGNMTRFLWVLGGRRKLNLKGTVFSWKKGNCSFSIDFLGRNGSAKKMLIKWRGEITP